MNRCAFVKADGERCRAAAQEGYARCYNHREDTRQARTAAASRGGRTGGNGRPGEPGRTGREVGALKRQLQKIADAVLDGAVSHGQAAVAVQALNAKARVLELERRWQELGEVEEKLLELERRLEALGRPS